MATILLADASRNIRDYCSRELEKCGHDVLVATCGEECLAVVETMRLDLIVLDLCMPGMSGIDTVQALVLLAPGVPIILFTSDPGTFGLKTFPAAVVACVTKSDGLSELKRRIDAVVSTPRGRIRPSFVRTEEA